MQHSLNTTIKIDELYSKFCEFYESDEKEKETENSIFLFELFEQLGKKENKAWVESNPEHVARILQKVNCGDYTNITSAASKTYRVCSKAGIYTRLSENTLVLQCQDKELSVEKQVLFYGTKYFRPILRENSDNKVDCNSFSYEALEFVGNFITKIDSEKLVELKNNKQLFLEVYFLAYHWGVETLLTKIEKILDKEELWLSIFNDLISQDNQVNLRKWVSIRFNFPAKILKKIKSEDLKNYETDRLKAFYFLCWRAGSFKNFKSEDISDNYAFKIHENYRFIDKRLLILSSSLYRAILRENYNWNSFNHELELTDHSLNALEFVMNYLLNKNKALMSFLNNEEFFSEVFELAVYLQLDFLIADLDCLLSKKLNLREYSREGMVQLQRQLEDWPVNETKSKCERRLEISILKEKQKKEREINKHLYEQHVISNLDSIAGLDSRVRNLKLAGNFGAKLLFNFIPGKTEHKKGKIAGALKKLNLSNIEFLAFCGVENVSAKVIAARLKDAPILKSFSVQLCDAKFLRHFDRVLRALARHCQHLEVLNLQNLADTNVERKLQEITSEMLKTIGKMEELEELHLGDCFFAPDIFSSTDNARLSECAEDLLNLPFLRVITLPIDFEKNNKMGSEFIKMLKQKGIEVRFPSPFSFIRWL